VPGVILLDELDSGGGIEKLDWRCLRQLLLQEAAALRKGYRVRVNLGNIAEFSIWQTDEHLLDRQLDFADDRRAALFDITVNFVNAAKQSIFDRCDDSVGTALVVGRKDFAKRCAGDYFGASAVPLVGSLVVEGTGLALDCDMHSSIIAQF